MEWRNEYYNQIQRVKTSNKYYYSFELTAGFIIGFIIDNLFPLTFGIPMRFLSKYGKVFYKTEVKHILIYKLLNMKYIGGFLRGFLK